jgi:hypothetical protein
MPLLRSELWFAAYARAAALPLVSSIAPALAVARELA